MAWGVFEAVSDAAWVEREVEDCGGDEADEEADVAELWVVAGDGSERHGVALIPERDRGNDARGNGKRRFPATALSVEKLAQLVCPVAEPVVDQYDGEVG